MTDTGLTIDQTASNSFNSAASIRKAIAVALDASVPKGKTGAAGIVGDDAGAHVFIATKVGERWTLAFGADMTRDGKHVSGSVKLAGVW